MGAIVAILGDEGDPELPVRLDRMLSRSPYRGAPQSSFEHGFAVGIQSLGWDASLATIGNWTVAMHGYIGNWPELVRRSGLELPVESDDAARFALTYERLGDGLFAKLRGEFSVLFYNRRDRVLSAVRDLVGCRPLFSHYCAGRWYVGSEIRQLLRGSGETAEVDPEGLIQEIFWKYDDPGRTHYRSVRRIAPGAIAHVPSADCAVSVGSPYWTPPAEAAPTYSVTEMSNKLRSTIDRCLTRSMPRRPFALSLSGGLDSACLWGLMASRTHRGDRVSRLGRPYSYVFPGLECNETDQILALMEFTQSEGVLVNASDHSIVNYLDPLARDLDGLYLGGLFMDELLAKQIAADGRRVVLSGTGADEWLGGSTAYLADELLGGHVLRFALDLFRYELPAGTNRPRFIAGRTVIPLLRRLGWVGRQNAPPHWLHPRRRVPIPRQSHRTGRGPACCSCSRRSLLNTLSTVQNWHEDECQEQLYAQHGIEIRYPYMDLDVIEFAFRSPGRAITDGRSSKKLLRLAMADVLPPSIRNSTRKTDYGSAIVRDLDGVVHKMQMDRWLLCDLEIVSENAPGSLVAESRRNDGSLFALLQLAVAECWARRIACDERWPVSPSNGQS